MNTYKHLRNVLDYYINYLNDVRSIFCEDPSRDFTRSRKISFKDVMWSIICMEAGSLKDELLKLNHYSIDTPTASAFVQARSKIKPDAFKTLLEKFNEMTRKDKLYKGYRLLAVDGCELPIDNSFHDSDTTLLRNGGTNKPYSAYHINALYDLLECTYADIIMQGQANMDENDAFCRFADAYNGINAIFIADRGYESYNGFEHVARAGHKYLIRVKDINSKTSITKSLGPFPDGEFDVDVFRMLTKKSTLMTKACPQLYKTIMTNMRFDFMNKDNPWYEFNCRIVRFKITEDTYECIITNLDRKEFSIDEIKELYNKRWGIETSFRELKYAIGLNALHSKKRKLIRQEIYARVLLYNFCQRIVQNIRIPRKQRKHRYQVNFSRAFHIIRDNLMKKGGKIPPVDNLIAKEILPIRPGRSNTRKVKPKKVVCFNYRYD